VTSSSGGGDLGPGSSRVVLTRTGPGNGIRYGAAQGATDGASQRVAIAYTTGSTVAVRVWDGSSIGPPSVAATWPQDGGGVSYAAGYGPAVLPTGANGLRLAVAGCRPRPSLHDPCKPLDPTARIDTLVTTSSDGTSWSPLDRITNASKKPYRTNDEPSVVMTGFTLRVAYDAYQRMFSDYRVLLRSKT
jgi:hypothetical protein